MTSAPVRAVTAGQRGDGALKRLPLGASELELGATLPGAQLAYETWGTLDAQGGNAVLVLHALTGDAHVTRGPGGTPQSDRGPSHGPGFHQDPAEPGWWEGLIGPGRAIDTERFFVVAPAMLGGCYGSTGPLDPHPDGSGPWGSRFPQVTLRDQARAEALLADHLGVDRWALVIGGSMGGARALEWACTWPERVESCAVIASTAVTSAEQLAWGQAQELAIRQDPDFRGGDYAPERPPLAGLGLARRIAHLSYRSPHELSRRFGHRAQPGEEPVRTAAGRSGRYQVESYLDHQADKLVHRFDPNSYLLLTAALMDHDVARGRGDLIQALRAAAGIRWFVADVDSDRLYLPEESQALAGALREAGAEVTHRSLRSPAGHDGFLIEQEQLARHLLDVGLLDR